MTVSHHPQKPTNPQPTKLPTNPQTTHKNTHKHTNHEKNTREKIIFLFSQKLCFVGLFISDHVHRIMSIGIFPRTHVHRTHVHRIMSIGLSPSMLLHIFKFLTVCFECFFCTCINIIFFILCIIQIKL